MITNIYHSQHSPLYHTTPEFDAFYSKSCGNDLSSCSWAKKQVQKVDEWHLVVDESYSSSWSQPVVKKKISKNLQSVQCSVTANSWPKCSARLLQQWSALESSQSGVLLIAQIIEYNLNNIRDDPPWLKLQGDIQIIGLNKWDKSCFKRQNIQAVFNLILIFCCVREGALQSSWTEGQHQSFLLVACLGCVQ